MNGRARSASTREALLDASTGLLSGFLYLSYVLSFAFLLPVQHAFAGRGRRSGLAAAAWSLLVIIAGQAVRMFELRTGDILIALAGILPPAALIAALAFINVKVGKLSTGAKILVASAALSAIAAPLVMRVTADQGFSAFLIESIGSTMSASGLGADSAAYVGEAVKSAITVLQCAFAPLLLVTLAASWWLGSVQAARKAFREGRADESLLASLRLDTVRVPNAALWPTLLCWAGLFATLATGQTGLLRAAAWNLALCAASLYAVQGLGVLSHLSRQFNATRILRLAAPLAVMTALLSATAGAVILIVLPLVGITEVWFPYRTIKGALK